MFSRAVTTKVVFALLLAMFLAWVGHASALLAPVNPQAFDANHGHSHDEPDAAAYRVAADHLHAPLTADHLHETAHLNALVAVPAQPERSTPAASPHLTIPIAPVFLIERPPRARYVL
ncbi:hypothetical protein [Metapseudomonas furukawaii]|uniref:Uncharacterized protein n=1 Tax=Metapseudomonas furukawaii TaxID=1149133 RepID=L8MNN0_METFU|nr:hypothetical protein [Pseudomonas furukawaii]ELS25317.1 hypothetical protein ppKF707_5098 [Pseudomonas furukawaii]ELS29096.1 hypothetical protein ppKF707_4087 [Pseudomonas furukawaii]BAU73875.1 hypothetical protein KF707C_21870 [Pseudomonas furukawaii]